MSVVIGCDSFLSLRNVRNGDLGRRLKDLRVWVDPNQLAGSRVACPEGVEIDSLIDFDPMENPALDSLIDATYQARKAYYDGWTHWNEQVGSIYRRHPRRPYRRLGALAVLGGRFLKSWTAGALGSAVSGRRACAEALRGSAPVSRYLRRFENEAPDALAVFSLEGNREMLLAEAAISAGIPVAVMIRSRDNLAAKIKHLPNAEAYFVWSDATRRFMLSMYPEIDPQRVRVTGSPQFDHHLDPAFRLDREAYFSRMGLDPGRPLIVYTMATPGLVDHEVDIVQHLADAAHAGKFFRKAQLLVRGHPRMFGSDLKLLRQEYPEAKSFPAPSPAPYRSPEHESEVVRLILEDEPVHLATLAFQDVQVNVCGTMTIDSAILDKPVVNVYYDLVRNLPSGLSVRRFYERSDVKQMMAYGASRLARTPDECVRLINQYLENPALDAAGRRRAREEDCGPLDGLAGERISAAMKDMCRDQRELLSNAK